MFRNSILAASLIAIAAMTNTAHAAISKPLHDDSCQKWERREVMKNYWLKRVKTDVWYCVSGESKGHTSSANTSFKGPSMASGEPATAPTPDAGSPSPSDTPSSSDDPGKGNNGKGTPNGGKTDGGDPPGGGNTGNDGEG